MEKNIIHMKNNKLTILSIVLTIFLTILSIVPANAGRKLKIDPSRLVETRYVNKIERDSHGRIKRSSTVLKYFKKIHPCPSTGLTYGKCPGNAIDHVIPLSCFGIDAVFNLQWLPVDIKSCSNIHCKDRFERLIYAPDPKSGRIPKNCKRGVIIK